MLLFLKKMHIQKSYTLEEATKRMERYCAYQERCHQQVHGKLREMRMIPEAIDQIVTHLISENYLNEERFAKAFARGKFRIKHWGKNRITAELKSRDISKFNIAIALREIEDQEYYQSLNELAEKRLRQITRLQLVKKRRKLADYLLYRGWESHLVYEKIRELLP